MSEIQKDYQAMYWEDYSDQESEDFDYIGHGDDIRPIDNVGLQAKELYRIYGSECEIKVYKETKSKEIL